MTAPALTFTEVDVPVQTRANDTGAPNPFLEAAAAAKARMKDYGGNGKALAFNCAGKNVAGNITLLRRAGQPNGITVRCDVVQTGTTTRLSSKAIANLRKSQPEDSFTITFWGVKRIEKPTNRKPTGAIVNSMTNAAPAAPVAAPAAGITIVASETPIADSIVAATPAVPTPAKAVPAKSTRRR